MPLPEMEILPTERGRTIRPETDISVVDPTYGWSIPYDSLDAQSRSITETYRPCRFKISDMLLGSEAPNVSVALNMR